MTKKIPPTEGLEYHSWRARWMKRMPIFQFTGFRALHAPLRGGCSYSSGRLEVARVTHGCSSSDHFPGVQQNRFCPSRSDHQSSIARGVPMGILMKQVACMQQFKIVQYVQAWSERLNTYLVGIR
ncbi:unnamed protein product [Sphacelaria rigidula]